MSLPGLCSILAAPLFSVLHRRLLGALLSDMIKIILPLHSEDGPLLITFKVSLPMAKGLESFFFSFLLVTILTPIPTVDLSSNLFKDSVNKSRTNLYWGWELVGREVGGEGCLG